MKKKITIAIDGYSACGKSTLAKALAKSLDYIFIDSGAMYRAVSLYFLEHNIDYTNLQEVEESLDNIDIRFKNINEVQHTFLNGRDVTKLIRMPAINKIVSDVAKISQVRRHIVEVLRSYENEGGIVMDGRDIGSVVFPNAELKLFITADKDVRTERRYQENISKGIHRNKKEIAENLAIRDHIDSTRDDSPLVQTDDAIVLDNSHLSRDEQLDFALRQVNRLIS